MAETRRPVRFRKLLAALVDGDVEFVIVGGVAAVLEGAPVSTFDLDVVYSLDDRNLDRLAAVLTDLEAQYVDPAGREVAPSRELLDGGGHHLLRTRYGRLDVLGSVGSKRRFPELLSVSRERSVHGLNVRVLALEAQIEIKKQAGRPKDKAVLALLQETLAERDSA